MQIESTSTGPSGPGAMNAGTDEPVHYQPGLVFVLGSIIAVFLLIGVAVLSSSTRDAVANCCSVPALLWVFFVPPSILIGVYGASGFCDAISYAVRRPTPGKSADDAMTFFRLWACFALASGFMATIVGLVSMLSALEDPMQLGPGMAVALLSQLYGVVVAVMCVAIAAIIGRRHNGPSSTLRLARQSAGVAGLTVVAGCMTVLVAFGIFMLAMPIGR